MPTLLFRHTAALYCECSHNRNILNATIKMEINFAQLITSPVLPHIGELVFEYLDFESILNCTKVCQTWNDFIFQHPDWWIHNLDQAQEYVRKQGMDQENSSQWIHICESAKDSKSFESFKGALQILKSSNDFCKSSFWEDLGSAINTQNALTFLKKRLLRRERDRFHKFQSSPVDVPVLSKNAADLQLVWNLYQDKCQFYNSCFSTIEQYCKDESWNDFKTCKLPSYPYLTLHDHWLQTFMIDKITNDNWKCDQVLIDALANGHHKLFETMFHLALNKNPTRRRTNQLRDNRETALIKAASCGNLEAVQMILKTVPVVTADKVEAFFAAGLMNRFPVLTYFLSIFNDKNPAKEPQRKTLLHEAAGLGNIQTFILVFEQCQDRNPRDRLGNCPLHQAVLFGQLELVKWIVTQVPESVGVINIQGRSPLDLARVNPYRNSNSDAIVEALSQFPFERPE